MTAKLLNALALLLALLPYLLGWLAGLAVAVVLWGGAAVVAGYHAGRNTFENGDI